MYRGSIAADVASLTASVTINAINSAAEVANWRVHLPAVLSLTALQSPHPVWVLWGCK